MRSTDCMNSEFRCIIIYDTTFGDVCDAFGRVRKVAKSDY